MKLLAIRLSYQKTIAKSLVISNSLMNYLAIRLDYQKTIAKSLVIPQAGERASPLSRLRERVRDNQSLAAFFAA
jgi:hypothetical protein